MNPELENQKPEENSPLPQIRTFQGDVADALKGQGESMFSIRRAELTKQGGGNEFAPRTTPQEEAENKSTEKAILLILGAILLMALGGVGTWYAFNTYKNKTALPAVITVPNKFISTESVRDVDVSGLARESFLGVFSSLQNEELKNARLEQIQLMKGVGTTTALTKTAEFFNILNTEAPPSLVRALNPLFMFGFIGDTTDASSTPHTFIIFKLDSFENSFAGMLAWEATLAEDLLPLFIFGELSAPIVNTFVDSTVQNKDARVLKDSTGRIVFLYSFFDNKMLILTDNETSLRTLVTKLNTSKLSR